MTDMCFCWLLLPLQVSLRSRMEVMDSYLIPDDVSSLFFSLGQWGFVGRVRQARLLCLGRLNHLMIMSVLGKKVLNIFSMMMAPLS